MSGFLLAEVLLGIIMRGGGMMVLVGSFELKFAMLQEMLLFGFVICSCWCLWTLHIPPVAL